MLKRNCVLAVSKRRRCARYGPTIHFTAAPHRSGRDLAAERAEIAGHGAENDATAARTFSASKTHRGDARTHETHPKAPPQRQSPEKQRKWPATPSPRA